MLPANIALFEEVERRAQLRLTREECRFLRERSDPFSLSNERFIDIFRLNKELVIHLFEELQPFMNDAVRITRVPYQQRILIALRFFATGNYQRGVGQEYLLAVSQPMVSRAVKEVSRLIVTRFANHWIKFPNEHEKQISKRIFFAYCGIPGVIGAIDCTHVRIITPSNEEHAYLNRKGYHSINVQLICDIDLRILNVNGRYPGSNHDSFIWRHSAAKIQMRLNYENGERNTWILGDSGYPQEPWLMTPIQGALPNSPEDRYNEAHATARNHIERTNGVLKGRFRCLLGERELRYNPEDTGTLINACCILHNMCINAGIAFNEPVERVDDADDDNYMANDENAHLQLGGQVRNNLVQRYFNAVNV